MRIMKSVKDNPYRIFTVLIFTSIFFATSGFFVSAKDQAGGNPGGSDTVRIEDDFNLQYEVGKSEELVNFLKGKYVDDDSFAKSLGPNFTGSFGDEDFTDTYFDTPNLDLYKRKIGLRHRLRVNRLDTENRKNGRELIQLKLSGDEKFEDKDNSGSRNEIKFDVVPQKSNVSTDDRHPILGLIDFGGRDGFKSRLRELGIDPYKLRPILTLNQRRRRVYINRDGATFISFSMDDVKSSLLWVNTEFSQLEVELNELAYTESDKVYREKMQEIRSGMIKDLRKKFSYLSHDQSAKYNKAFDLLSAKIPWMKFWVRIGFLRGREPGR